MTHPVSFRSERHILYPNFTFSVFHNNSKYHFFTIVHTFSLILLMSEYVLKPQTIPFLFLVFQFEAKDTPSPMVLLPLHLYLFVWCFLFFKYNISTAPFLLLLFLLLAFRDERNMWRDQLKIGIEKKSYREKCHFPFVFFFLD